MKSFRSKLRRRVPLLGTWLTMFSPAIAEMACRAGFDWIAIDLEHSCLTTDQSQELIRIADLMGGVPLVRLSTNDEVLIKRVMDAGAHGIIVPMIKSLADVVTAHASLHYPPKGRRGVGLSRAQKYGAGFESYQKWLSEEAVLLVQLEHKDVLPHLDEIFGSGLIDGYIIGPYDLSASLGVPGQLDHIAVVKAVKTISTKADKYKIPKGIHIIEINSEALNRRIKENYSLIAYGVDFRILETNYSSANTLFKSILSTSDETKA